MPSRIMEVTSNATSSDRDTASKELIRSYQIATKIERLLPLVPLGEEQSVLAERLLEQVLGALTMGLSVFVSADSGPSFTDPTTAGPSSTSASDAVTEVLAQVKTPTSRCRRKRACRDRLRTMTSWTEAPLYDPYQWRKYGEKQILKTKLLRTYYGCSYKEGGCQATKRIDRKDNSGQALYQVTYFEHHTCQMKPKTPCIASDPVITKPSILNFGSNIAEQCIRFSSLSSEQQGCELTANGKHKEVQVPSSSTCTMAQVETAAAAVEEEHLEAVAHSGVEDLLASACSPSTWEDMVMEYLVKFGSAEGFVSF